MWRDARRRGTLAAVDRLHLCTVSVALASLCGVLFVLCRSVGVLCETRRPWRHCWTLCDALCYCVLEYFDDLAPPGRARNVRGPGRASSRQQLLCEVRMGSLNVGTMERKALEVVEMMKRQKMEVLCVQETKRRGDRARKMAEGHKMLHVGGDGRSNGVGIIVNEEISNEVVRVERWQGMINAVRMMIRQQMVCVICVYGPQIGRTEAEKEAFREEVERLADLSDGQAMLCVAGDSNAHIGVVECKD